MLASPEVAGALDVDIGSALIALTRVVYDDCGRGVEHLHALYRPDRYALPHGSRANRRRRRAPLVAGRQFERRKSIHPSGKQAPARQKETSHDETQFRSFPPRRAARLGRRRDRRPRRARVSSRATRRP